MVAERRQEFLFIRDVEVTVGLSKKNIRYYEEVGLIKPGRNGENDSVKDFKK